MVSRFFPAKFSPPAEVIALERNYRSTQPILAAANGVIDLAAERFTKNLRTERASAALPQLVSVRDDADQARYVVERVLESREKGSTLKQQAVLFRTSHHCGPLEVELTRRNIPFVKYGGLKFLDAAHIRDILALLRFVENPHDGIAGSRLMQLIPGLGPVFAQRVLDRMMGAADPTRALLDTPSPTRAADDWGRFVETVISLRALRGVVRGCDRPYERKSRMGWVFLYLPGPSLSSASGSRPPDAHFFGVKRA
jgi:DNA helicase II / ATP-dependent DNA helicase PcrA